MSGEENAVDEAFRYISLAFAIASVATSVICAPFFILRRNIQPLKARSYPILFCFWISILGLSIYWVMELSSPEIDCIGTEIWLKGVSQNLLVISIFLMCLRLYLVYSVAKAILSISNQDSNKSESEDGTPSSTDTTHVLPKDRKNRLIRYGVRMYQTNNLIKALLFFLSIVILLSAIATVFFQMDDPTCSGPLISLAAFLVTGISMLFLLILAILLWNVHDAYLLKQELKGMLIVAVVISVPGFIMSSLEPTEWIGTALRVAFFWLVQIPVYIIPIYKSFDESMKKWDNSFQRTASAGDEMKSRSTQTTSSSELEEDKIPFANYPSVRDFLAKGDIGQEYLHSYIAHVQHLDASKMMLFLKKHYAMRNDTNVIRSLAKTTLLFQEFLQEGAYLSIRHLFNPEDVDSVKEKLDEYLKEVEKNTDGNSAYSFNINSIVCIFDDFLEEIEQRLYQQVFEPFFKSDFYEQFQKRGALDVGVSTSSIKKTSSQ